MKISASVFSNPHRPLEDLVRELEACGVDFIHVDCNDDMTVGESIARIRAASTLPIDLHIISPDPEKFWPMVKEHKVDKVTLQVEDLGERIVDLPDLGCEWGMSLVTDTPIAAFEPYADRCSFVLFMTTTPGQSGGKFDKANFAKIRSFHRTHRGKRIHVDGGVNAEISFVLRNMGVFCAVSGSFLVKAPSLAKAFLDLLVQKSDNHLFVRDIMHDLGELPVLDVEKGEIGPVLQAIEDFRMGYCLFVDGQGNLAGMVTNADVRRGLLRQLPELKGLDLESVLNKSPKRIQEDLTVSEMLRYVKGLDFLVLNLPVVDGHGRLVGAVNFNQLILGEL